jgi:hypothetical protein
VKLYQNLNNGAVTNLIFIMATAALARRTTAQSMAQRTLAISVYPSPTNFAERRSILQVLEQYGQVDFFKSLPVSIGLQQLYEIGSNRNIGIGTGPDVHFGDEG